MSNSAFGLLINGDLVTEGETLAVTNPANGQMCGSYVRARKSHIDAAVAAAKAAQPRWAQVGLAERGEKLLQMARVIDDNIAELASLMTMEQGKPLAESHGELGWASDVFREVAKIDMKPEVYEDSAERYAVGHRVPLGVVAAISPWNFPVSTPVTKVAPALYTGNTVVLKPAATTPLTILRFAELVKDILPAGVFNVVVDDNDLGSELTGHPDVAQISFTGSTATGKKIITSGADTVKRVLMELGGNDPAIVLDDVDVEEAADGIYAGTFANCGQVCVAIKRVYAPEAIYDDLCDALARRANAAVVGDGAEQGTTIGPVQNRAQYERLKSLLDDTRANGTIIAGGEVIEGEGFFMQPTIVRDAKDGSRIVDEEQFGPILPIIRYTTIDEAVAAANASPYGLGSSVWGKDAARAYEVSRQLQAGSTWINRHRDNPMNLPFGGAKQSGFGVEHTLAGLEEYTQLHVVTMPGHQKPAL